MLVGLLRGKPAAQLLHHGLRAAPHRPIIIGPVLAQAWRPDPKTVHGFSQYLRDCTVPQTRDGTPPIQGAASVPAGLHGPAQILTSDPDDITAYAATLDHADIAIEQI